MFATVILCLACLASAGRPPHDLSIQWVYVSNHATWTAAPKDPELPKYVTASVTLAVFCPSGDFGEGWFTLGRYPGKDVFFILPGEGFLIQRGKWRRNSDGSLAVESRVVYVDKVLLRLQKRQPTQEAVRERWLLHGSRPGRLAAALASPRQEYVPLQGLSNLKTLADLMQSSPGQDSSAP